MKTSKLSAHSGFLALGMFLYSCVALSVFQHFFFVASTLWMTTLVVLGFAIRRHSWPTLMDASKVVGFGLLGFLAILFMIGLFQGQGVVDTLWITGLMMGSFYAVWFWLPFIVGAALGGINRRKIQIPNKTLHPTAGRTPVCFRASLPAVDELDVRSTSQGAFPDVYTPKIFRSVVSPSEDTEARLAKGE